MTGWGQETAQRALELLEHPNAEAILPSVFDERIVPAVAVAVAVAVDST